MHLKFQLQLKNKQNNIMASPITQRVKSYAKQVVIDQDKLKIAGTPGVPDVVTDIHKDLGVTFTGEDGGDEYVKSMTAERDKRQPNMPLKDYMKLKDRQNAQSGSAGFQGTENGENVDATQWSNQDVEYGNRTDQEVIKGSEGKPATDAYLDPKYKTNLSRSQAANQRRRENMLDRSTKRDNKRNYRLLKKTKRKVGSLTPDQQKQFDYLEKNRFTDGQMNDYNKDSSGNITGNKLQDGSSSLNNPIGWNEQISGTQNGQTQATLANIERYEKETGVKPTVVNDVITNKKQTAGAGVGKAKAKPIKDNPKTGYVQKAYSGFQKPPTPKKQVGGELLDKAGNKIGDVSNTGSFSKVSSDIVPYKGPKVKSLGTGGNAASGGTKLLNKVNKGLNNLPDKGKIGLLKKIGLGVTGAGLGYLGYKVATASTPPPPDKTNDDVDVKPKKGKSYDQAYQDRDRKTYGHMNKSNYIKEAKRQNDVFAKTGKWDYKNDPKDPGPVSSIKPAKVAPVSTNVKPEANVNLDKISQPERKPTISNKQGKALNKLNKLEGRKQTSRRDIRIAKQKDKAAGLSRKQVRQNKQMRKAGNKPSGSQSQITMPRVMNSSQYEQVKKLGNGSAIDAVTSGKVTIKGLEDQLKASTFRQKGWSGYQK